MITAIQFILALSLLIILHEGGHFLFAKLFKTRVEKFYLFFDFLFPFSNLFPFSLFKKKVGDTEYGIGWFPLGGYVKISGMIDESMDKDQMAKPPEPWEFRSKPAWQRLLIMLGGIIVNVITAFVIYTFVMYAYGEQKLPMSEVNSKGGITVYDSMGYRLGFQDGDKILTVDNEPLQYFDDVMAKIIVGKQVVVERNGKNETINLPQNLVGQLVDNNKQTPFLYYSMPAIVGEVVKDSYAEKAGLQKGDIITAINNKPTYSFTEFKTALAGQKGNEVALTVLRNNIDSTKKMAEKDFKVNTLTLQSRVSDSGTLGFVTTATDLEYLDKMGVMHLQDKKFTFAQSIPAGIHLSIDRLNSYIGQFKLMLNPKTEAYKGLGGFYSMSKIYGNQWDWHRFWNVTAFLSLILAFMNLLPIPGLDGGYVMFTLWEMLTGKKVSERVMEVATTVGLVLILFLMVYANGNDIIRNFFTK